MKIISRIKILFVFTILFSITAWAQLYWNGSGIWTGANVWGLSNGGPYSQTWSTNSAIFGVQPSTITGATAQVTGITATADVTFTAGGTLGTNGTVAPIDVASGKTFDMSTQAISTAAGTGFIKTGSGTLAFAGSAYAGGFTLNAGTVVLRGINALGNGTVTLNGGIVAANANRTITASSLTIILGGNVQFGDDVVLGVSGNSANTNFPSTCTVALGSVTRTLTLGNGGNQVFNGVISGNSGSGITFAATPTGTGRFDIINAANTFTGDITITGGEVRFTADGSLGNSSNAIIIDGGRFGIVSGGSVAVASTHAIKVGSTIGTSISAPGAAGVLTYNGVIEDKTGSTGSWAKQGAGTLQLGGVSTYTGNTAINNGILKPTAGNNRLPVITVVSIGQAAATNIGTFDLNGNDQEIGGLVSTTGTNATTGNNTVTSSSAATLTISGSGTYSYGDGSDVNSGIINGLISLVKTGSGTQILGDSNTYTGLTTVSGGTLQFTKSGGNTISVTNNIVINGGTLKVSTNQMVNDLVLSSGTLIIDPGCTLNVTGTYINSGGTLVNNGTFLAKSVTPPSAPVGLVVSDSSNATVTIRWNKNVETDFLKYMIYRSTSANPTTVADSTSGGLIDTTKTFTGLVNGTRYYFRITGLDSSRNESAYSNEVSATPNDRVAPAAPAGLAVTDSSSAKIVIRWRKNAETDFLRYRIYRGTSAQPTTKVDSTTNGIADTSKTFTGLANGTRYYLRVTAVDSAGNESGYSNEVNAIPADRIAPAAPTGLAVTDSSSGKIVIRWRKNAETDFLRYRIYRGTSAQPIIKVDSTTNGIADTIKTFTGLTNGTRYYIRVTAVDSAGNESGFSNEVNAAPGPVVGVQQAGGQIPKVFSLLHNYPNPFNPSTVLHFSVAKTHHATLKVYDILGNMVAVLFEGLAEEGRIIAVQFNADALPSGVYYARLQSGSETAIQRMMLMK